jgi:hypothetical protein
LSNTNESATIPIFAKKFESKEGLEHIALINQSTK